VAHIDTELCTGGWWPELLNGLLMSKLADMLFALLAVTTQLFASHANSVVCRRHAGRSSSHL